MQVLGIDVGGSGIGGAHDVRAAATFAWFMVDVLAKAVLLTWMYNGTRGSLLLVTLFHASFNTAGVLLPVANTVSGGNMGASILIYLLEAIVAIMVVAATGSERLSRSEPKQVQEWQHSK